jgi:hypothetical protein
MRSVSSSSGSSRVKLPSSCSINAGCQPNPDPSIAPKATSVSTAGTVNESPTARSDPSRHPMLRQLVPSRRRCTSANTPGKNIAPAIHSGNSADSTPPLRMAQS